MINNNYQFGLSLHLSIVDMFLIKDNCSFPKNIVEKFKEKETFFKELDYLINKKKLLIVKDSLFLKKNDLDKLMGHCQDLIIELASAEDICSQKNVKVTLTIIRLCILKLHNIFEQLKGLPFS